MTVDERTFRKYKELVKNLSLYSGKGIIKRNPNMEEFYRNELIKFLKDGSNYVLLEQNDPTMEEDYQNIGEFLKNEFDIDIKYTLEDEYNYYDTEIKRLNKRNSEIGQMKKDRVGNFKELQKELEDNQRKVIEYKKKLEKLDPNSKRPTRLSSVLKKLGRNVK